jgi:hypothetical protein
MTTANGGVPFRCAAAGVPLPRQPLPRDADAVVVIAGGGFGRRPDRPPGAAPGAGAAGRGTPTGSGAALGPP